MYWFALPVLSFPVYFICLIIQPPPYLHTNDYWCTWYFLLANVHCLLILYFFLIFPIPSLSVYFVSRFHLRGHASMCLSYLFPCCLYLHAYIFNVSSISLFVLFFFYMLIWFLITLTLRVQSENIDINSKSSYCDPGALLQAIISSY